MRFQLLGGRCSGRLLSVLRGHISGSSGAQLLHVADLCLMFLSSLRRFTKWIQRSADPRSNDMKTQGGKGQRGAEGCQISPKENDGEIVSNVGKYRREGGGS